MEVTNKECLHTRILKDIGYEIEVGEEMPVYCRVVTKGFHVPCKITICYI